MSFGGALWGTPGTNPIPVGELQAQSYIYLALRRAGHLRPGYQPSQELLNDSLLEWQILFDELNAERTMNYSIPTQQFVVTGPGSQTGGNGYQLGPTALDWVGFRPESIVRANCVMTNQGPQPVYIQMQPLSAEQWASLAIQQIPGINVTTFYYWDPQYPNGVFNVFPPLIGNSIQIYSWGVLQAPSSLSDIYSGPPGYAEMVVCCLAERLHPIISKELNIHPVSLQMLRGKAHAAREKIRHVNRPTPKLGTDFAGRRNGGATDGFYDSFVTDAGIPY
jgi:hypothetical protein